MTSSALLTKRREQGEIWNIRNFSRPGLPLGGWEDHYIINGAVRNCHPDYYSVPIGNPYGFAVCIKKRDQEGRSIRGPPKKVDYSKYNGVHKFSADLYDPTKTEQTQMFNPYAYKDRRLSNEEELIRDDYLRLPMKYNSNGIKPVRPPGYEHKKLFGFSYLKDNPPYKFDVTRLVQPYPVWKNEQEHLTSVYEGFPEDCTHTELDDFDQAYTVFNSGF